MNKHLQHKITFALGGFLAFMVAILLVCMIAEGKNVLFAEDFEGRIYSAERGYFEAGGKTYYAHKTGSKAYPKGSLTKGQFRIEKGNRWFAYSINYGRMYLKSTYVRKGRFRKCIDLEIRKDHTVRYVYNNASTVRGSIRYSTAERRLQRDEGFGDWHTVEGMQFIPDGWVDFQK